MKIYRNKKTNNLYYLCGEVMNTTNNVNVQKMILYKNKISYDKGYVDYTYVRERKEFFTKFELYKEE